MKANHNVTVDFGYRTVNKSEKQKLVKDVFNTVADKYDLMNDLTSFGIHRAWKNDLINWLSPQKNQKLADLAGGTGDIAHRFVNNGGGSAYIIDANLEMIKAGLKQNNNNKNLFWTAASAENIPLPDNSFERATIAFGLRNITNRDIALKEIFRILKPGGRFVCLEFSHLKSAMFKKIYDIWSFKAMPFIGEKVTGNKKAYSYLVESIRKFPNQNELAEQFVIAGFSRVRYRNLSNGIVALHSGWKL
jgi:demethylmenaquinone methyltransferase/2-methoxy-6-polyprenyl-1,4-benzoquinol methylase